MQCDHLNQQTIIYRVLADSDRYLLRHYDVMPWHSVTFLFFRFFHYYICFIFELPGHVIHVIWLNWVWGMQWWHNFGDYMNQNVFLLKHNQNFLKLSIWLLYVVPPKERQWLEILDMAVVSWIRAFMMAWKPVVIVLLGSACS